MFLEGKGELGLHHEVLYHVWGAPADKARRRVAVLDEIRWDALVGWTGRASTVGIVVRCGGGAAGLGGHVHLRRRVRLDFEDAKAGRI